MIDDNTTLAELGGLLAGAGLQLVSVGKTDSKRAPRWNPVTRTLHQPRAWTARVEITPAHRRSDLPFLFEGDGDTVASAINSAVKFCVAGWRQSVEPPTDDDLRDEAAERRCDERRGR